MVAREKREKRNVKMNSGILMVGVVGGGGGRGGGKEQSRVSLVSAAGLCRCYSWRYDKEVSGWIGFRCRVN